MTDDLPRMLRKLQEMRTRHQIDVACAQPRGRTLKPLLLTTTSWGMVARCSPIAEGAAARVLVSTARLLGATPDLSLLLAATKKEPAACSA